MELIKLKLHPSNGPEQSFAACEMSVGSGKAGSQRRSDQGVRLGTLPQIPVALLRAMSQAHNSGERGEKSNDVLISE